MSLKLNNQLAHLPNGITITRFEKHHSCMELIEVLRTNTEDRRI